MHPSIRVSVEAARGCGYRSAGGLYLVADGPGRPCGKLPLPLDVCPVCGAGIKPSRGWTWVNGAALAAHVQCRPEGLIAPFSIFRPKAGDFPDPCRACPMRAPSERVGLLWIGEKFYATPDDFSAEARARGISRRIPALPRGFNLLTTWVWLAHRSALVGDDGKPRAGVIQVFKPDRVEVIVTGDELDEEIDGMISRGLSPVKVVRDVDHAPLFDGDPSRN